jgi:hypothetical protein
MYQACFVEKSQAIKQLLGENTNECRRETTELILFNEFVQIYAEQLKDEAQMLSVYKGIFQSEEVVVIVFVELRIQLRSWLV